jgi:hypothetical protein
MNVYPSISGLAESIVGKLSSSIAGDVVQLMVHDGDVFYYDYYSGGQLIDRYSSDPDYFGPVSNQERAALKGRHESLAPLLSQADVQKLAAILSDEWQPLDADPGQQGSEPGKPGIFMVDGVPDAAARLSAMASLLGITNVLTSYEYLESGDADNIKGWKRFAHIPDLRARKRSEQSKLKAQTTALNKEGLLLASESKRGPDKYWPFVPTCFPDQSGGFVVIWKNYHVDAGTHVQRYQAPWTSGEPVRLPLRGLARQIVLSPSGKLAAVQCGSDRDEIDVYRLEDGQTVTTISHGQVKLGAVPLAVAFTPDERKIISRGHRGLDADEGIYLDDLGGLNERKTINLNVAGGFNRVDRIACHPQGRFLITDVSADKLAILDVEECRVVSVLKTAGHGLAGWMAAAALGEKVTGYRPNESLRTFEFSPDGSLVFCGMEEGVRVYRWEDMLRARKSLPDAIASAPSELTAVGTGAYPSYHRMTYDLTFDWRRNLLVFAGLEGKIQYLEVESNRSGTLLEVPGRPAILNIGLSSDLKVVYTVSLAGMFDRGPRKPQVLQLWNYSLLADQRI